MPLALILIAIGLILAGVRGKYKELGALLVGDFTGQGNFLNWLVAIGIVGCIGYVPALQRWTRLFIVLIILAMFLEQGDGLFAKFISAIQGAQGTASDPSPGNPSGQSSSGSGGIAGAIMGALGIPSVGSNPLGTLPGATTNPLAAAGGVAGLAQSGAAAIPKTPVTVPGIANPVTMPGAADTLSTAGFVNP